MTHFVPSRISRLIKDRPAHVLTCVWLTLLWIILVLPTIFLNELFTLDVANIFNVASHFSERLNWILSPYTLTGRYVPAYWLYHCLLYAVFGFNVQGYYAVLAVIFLLGSLIAGTLLAILTRHAWIGILFGIAFYLSSPNVETIYTLCKSEPFVFLLLAGILLLFHKGSAEGKPLSKGKLGAMMAAFLCSMWFKETSVTMLAFPIAGLAVVQFLRRRGILPAGEATAQLRRYGSLLSVLMLGFALSKLPFLLFHRPAITALRVYTAFSLTWRIVSDNLLFYLEQQPDVTVLGLIATLFVAAIVKRVLDENEKLDERDVKDLAFVVSFVTMAWAYSGVFLIWRWPMAYYVYMPAILFRIAAGYGLYMAFRLNLFNRSVRAGACVAYSLLLVYAAVFLWYAGSIQVRYSRVYSNALREYVKVSHPGDSLTFESYPFYSEQVESTRVLLPLVFRAKRELYGIADVLDPGVVTPEMRELMGITDADLAANEKHFPKLDDYVIVMTGNDLATWQIRGAAPYYSEGSFLRRDGGYDMQPIAGERSYFPSAFINIWDFGIDFRQTYVGYELYRITAGPRFTWAGRYPDGWMGRRARLTLYPKYVANALVRVSTSRYNRNNRVRVYRNDTLVETAPLPEGEERVFKLQPDGEAAPSVFRFEVEKYFVPRKLHLNKDERELGAIIRLEPFAP
jgi:hypothetical protein